MTEINSNQQRILITGVSGLVGRILFNYLTKTYPNKYQVFGVDQHTNISSRYQAKNNENLPIEPILPLSSDNFFQCDITDRTKFHEIIQEQQIEIIIHLAAVLETDPDLKKISYVNIQGAKNVFEAPGVQRIIYASTVMTVFGYLNQEPYRSIFNDTFDDKTMLPNLRIINAENDPPLPDTRSPGNIVYCQSKILAEQMANEIVKKSSKSIICVRVGWVNIYDQPGTTPYRTIWLSHRDACLFIDKTLQAPLHISGTYFASSNNHRLWVDLERAKKDLDFVPQDGAEKL